MKLLKKILLMVVTIALLVPNTGSVSLAADMGDFVVKDGVLTAYKGSSADVVIPEDLGITGIGDRAFSFCYTMKSIMVPGSIKTIGEGAFEHSNVETVVLKYGVLSIGEDAFSYCQQLNLISIPDSVTTIGDGAFLYDSSLKAAPIPDSVTSIGDDVFRETAIEDPVIANYGKVLCYVPKTFASYDIPSTVMVINGGAFFGNENLTSINIPSQVTEIGGSAFAYCEKLKTVIIQNGVTTIDELAFSDCKQLTSVTLPDSLTSIGEGAFTMCRNLKSINVPQSVKSVGSLAFFFTAISEPIIVDHGKLLCYVPGSFTSFIIPTTVTTINDGTMYSCDKLEVVKIPDSVTKIGAQAFQFCKSLKSVAIPSGVSSIEKLTFEFCESLENVVIPSGVKSIGQYAFTNCFNLKKIYVPDTVTDISNDAFVNHFPIPLCAPSGSYTEKFAKQKNMPFIALEKIYQAPPSSSTVLINGKSVSFEAYTIDGNNYFKLRDVAMALNETGKKFDVSYDPDQNMMLLTSGKAYMPVGGELSSSGNKNNLAASLSEVTVTSDGYAVNMTAYTINGYNYFKLRDIAAAIDFGVTWDAKTNTIGIDTSVGYAL